MIRTTTYKGPLAFDFQILDVILPYNMESEGGGIFRDSEESRDELVVVFNDWTVMSKRTRRIR